MGKIKVPKAMHAYKVAWLAGAEQRTLKSKLSTEYTFATKPQNIEWYGEDGFTVRNICLLRLQLIKKYKNYKSYDSFEKPLDKDTCEYDLKTRLEENLTKLPTGIQNELSELYKQPLGCLKMVNYISEWLYDNIQGILDEQGIPYSKAIADKLFIYPGFETEEQIISFGELRVSTDYSSAFGVLIPTGSVPREVRKSLFLGDEVFYSFILGIEPTEVILPDKVTKHWFGDQRYDYDEEQSELIESEEESKGIQDYQEDEQEDQVQKQNQQEEQEQQDYYQSDIDDDTREYEEQWEVNNSTECDTDELETKSHNTDQDVNDLLSFNSRNHNSGYFRNLKVYNKFNFNGPVCRVPQYFAGERDRVVIAVDCDNVNFFRAILAIKDAIWCYNVVQIQLHVDPKSLYIWNLFENFIETSAPIIRNSTCRVRSEKSSVDIAVATGVCEALYRYNCNRVLLFSSDSDFLALIDSISRFKPNDDIQWLVCYEQQQTNQSYLGFLDSRGVNRININGYMWNIKLPDDVVQALVEYTVGYVYIKRTVDEWFNSNLLNSVISNIIGIKNRFDITDLYDRKIQAIASNAINQIKVNIEERTFKVNNMDFRV